MSKRSWWSQDRKDPDDRLHTEHRPRSKKDRKRWCRGKEGVPHQAVVVFHPRLPTTWTCGWREWTTYRGSPRRHYSCWHIEQCTECGKTLKDFLAEACPDRR